MSDITYPSFSKEELKEMAAQHAQTVYEQRGGSVLQNGYAEDYMAKFPHDVEWVYSPAVGKKFTGNIADLTPCSNSFCSWKGYGRSEDLDYPEYKGYYKYSVESGGPFAVLCHNCFSIRDIRTDAIDEIFDDYVYAELERLIEADEALQSADDSFEEFQQRRSALKEEVDVIQREHDAFCSKLIFLVALNDGILDHRDVPVLMDEPVVFIREGKYVRVDLDDCILDHEL